MTGTARAETIEASEAYRGRFVLALIVALTLVGLAAAQRQGADRDDGARHARLPRGVSHALSGVAGADRPDAALPLFLGKFVHNVLLAFLFFASVPLLGQDMASLEKRITVRKLPNGLTVWLVTRPGFPRVAAVLASQATLVDVAGAATVTVRVTVRPPELECPIAQPTTPATGPGSANCDRHCARKCAPPRCWSSKAPLRACGRP